MGMEIKLQSFRRQRRGIFPLPIDDDLFRRQRRGIFPLPIDDDFFTRLFPLSRIVLRLVHRGTVPKLGCPCNRLMWPLHDKASDLLSAWPLGVSSDACERSATVRPVLPSRLRTGDI